MTYVKVSDHNITVTQCADKHGGRLDSAYVYAFDGLEAAAAFVDCVEKYSGGQIRAEILWI
jgi:hypothetical protein